MKRFFAYILAVAFSCCLHAQVVDTTVCDILKAPQSFNGKIVRVKATVAATVDQFVVQGGDCGLPVNDIWLSYPEGTKGKAGPAVMVSVQPARNFAGALPAVQRTPVKLDKNDKAFKQFDSLLATPFSKAGMCLGCNLYVVNATLVGRLDGVADATLQRDSTGKITGFGGFGHMNAYSARLVLESVSDVTSKQVDYSKAIEATKGEPLFNARGAEGGGGGRHHGGGARGPSSPNGGGGDPVEAAHHAAQTFGPGNPMGSQIERAADAFGKGKEDPHNGVEIEPGAANEAAANDEGKGAKDSPDGLLFRCTFNSERLSPMEMNRAIVFAGENVANLRNPLPGANEVPFALLENRAWITTVLDTVASKQTSLTLPGGYLIWNAAWPQTEANQKVGAGILDFLTNEELLGK